MYQYAMLSITTVLCYQPCYQLLQWSSYTIPDCTCLKLLMMGECDTRNR